MDIAELLAQHVLFADLSDDERRDVTQIARHRSVARGSTVFQKGDQGDAMFGVLSGTIAIQIASADGEHRTVNHLTQGELFGEIAIIDGEPRTADAIASRDTALMVIHRADFWRLVDKHPKVLIPLLNFLCARLRWLNVQTEESAFLNSEQRLARKLRHLSEAQAAKQHGIRMREVIVSQTELSELVGISRESVNKILQGWKKDGLVDLGRGRIEIKDWAGLEHR